MRRYILAVLLYNWFSLVACAGRIEGMHQQQLYALGVVACISNAGVHAGVVKYVCVVGCGCGLSSGLCSGLCGPSGVDLNKTLVMMMERCTLVMMMERCMRVLIVFSALLCPFALC